MTNSTPDADRAIPQPPQDDEVAHILSGADGLEIITEVVRRDRRAAFAHRGRYQMPIHLLVQAVLAAKQNGIVNPPKDGPTDGIVNPPKDGPTDGNIRRASETLLPPPRPLPPSPGVLRVGNFLMPPAPKLSIDTSRKDSTR